MDSWAVIGVGRAQKGVWRQMHESRRASVWLSTRKNFLIELSKKYESLSGMISV